MPMTRYNKCSGLTDRKENICKNHVSGKCCLTDIYFGKSTCMELYGRSLKNSQQFDRKIFINFVLNNFELNIYTGCPLVKATNILPFSENTKFQDFYCSS